MINGQSKQHQGNRENLQAKYKKGYNAIKKTESIKSKHRKYISEDSNNRKNKTHQGTHNIK